MVDDDVVTLCIISRVSTHIDLEKCSGTFCWSFLVFLFFYLSFGFTSGSHVSLERKRTGARIMGREGTTLGFYSWGIKYEQSVREVKPYLLFENQCRIRERNDDNRHSRSLFHSPLPFPFFLSSFSFLFFSFFVCFFWFARHVLRL